MKNLMNMRLEEKREALKAIRSNMKVLIESYRETDSPSDTVAKLIDKIGYTAAEETIAELINTVGEWDGRIDRSTRAWAASIHTAATRDELEACRIYQPSEIHPAHIDQIGRAMMKA